MWCLLMLLQSPVAPDAKMPVETFYETQKACLDALQIENDKGHFNGFCTEVTWK